MKAMRFHPPGGPEKLQLDELPIPEPTEPDQLLIKVAYASIIWSELLWPIYQGPDGTYIQSTPCRDYAGTVVATGPNASSSGIKVGDEVLCFPNERSTTGASKNPGGLKYPGGLAEYALADTKSCVPKPKGISMLHAASMSLSALTAWQALFDQASPPLSKGQKLLVTGAAGSTGTWAVQFAKRVGAHVVGTASSAWSKRALAELGCDEVVDYKTQSPLSEYVKEVDLVLDCAGGDVGELGKVVKAGGQVVSIVAYDIQQKLDGVQTKFFVWTQNAEQMGRIADMVGKGEMKTFVDSVFPLERAEEAFRKGQAGHLEGKVMVEVGGENANGSA